MGCSVEPDSNRNCPTLAWYPCWYSSISPCTKLRLISCLEVLLDAGQGQIAALEVQDNSSIWLAASAIGIEPWARQESNCNARGRRPLASHARCSRLLWANFVSDFVGDQLGGPDAMLHPQNGELGNRASFAPETA